MKSPISVHDSCDADTEEKLIVNIKHLSHSLQRLYEGKASQKRVLIILKRHPCITQKELTERLAIQPGSVSELLSKLEKSGLILRTPGRSDRRTSDITLTAEGAKAAQEALNQRKKRHEEWFSCMTEEEKRQLLNQLEKLSADWNRRFQEAEEPRQKK